MQTTDIVALEGNGYRPSHRGGGYNEENIMFTLNSTEVHAVAYEVKNETNMERKT